MIQKRKLCKIAFALLLAITLMGIGILTKNIPDTYEDNERRGGLLIFGYLFFLVWGYKAIDDYFDKIIRR